MTEDGRGGRSRSEESSRKNPQDSQADLAISMSRSDSQSWSPKDRYLGQNRCERLLAARMQSKSPERCRRSLAVLRIASLSIPEAGMGGSEVALQAVRTLRCE